MWKLKAKPLEKGSKIGIVAPASPVSAESVLTGAVECLKQLGFRVILGNSTVPRDGYLAGNDQKRASDLEQLWEDDSLAAIWCLRGGYGSSRILSQLNYNLWSRTPKILVGFSDITALELALWSQVQLVSFHGPVLTTLNNPFSSGQALKTLSGRPGNECLEWPGDRQPCSLVTLQPGRAEGLLLGGNLATLVSLLGTPYFPDLAHGLLFIEEVNEAAYRIDRMLTQLRHCGVLGRLRGILIGQCVPIPGETSTDLIAVFQERLADLKIPVAYGWPIGHLDQQWTLPQGVTAEFDADSGWLRLCESPFDLV